MVFFIQTWKTKQCVSFFTQTNKKKHTGGPFIYQDLKKVIISILFEKVCLGWKFSLIINVGGGGKVGLGMSWVKKIEKLISRVGRILGTHEEFFSNNSELHISFQ